MKKIVTIVAVALFGALVLPSCKKDYTCVCTSTVNGVSTSVEAKTGKMSKKDAEAACEQTVSAGGVTMECKLK
ncbi:MAG: hypothetical protein WC756_05680 [Taibaiella sp.]|jgi:hypothetical protein